MPKSKSRGKKYKPMLTPKTRKLDIGEALDLDEGYKYWSVRVVPLSFMSVRQAREFSEQYKDAADLVKLDEDGKPIAGEAQLSDEQWDQLFTMMEPLIVSWTIVGEDGIVIPTPRECAVIVESRNAASLAAGTPLLTSEEIWQIREATAEVPLAVFYYVMEQCTGEAGTDTEVPLKMKTSSEPTSPVEATPLEILPVG